MKAVIAFLALLSAFLARPLRAQVPDWSQGPSVAAMAFRFDCRPGGSDPCVKALGAGAGYTLRWNSPARSRDGQLAYVSLDLTALADFSSMPASGALSVAAGPSFFNGLVGVQAGYKLFELVDGAPTEGLFALAGGRRNAFFLLSLSINFAFGQLPHTAQYGAVLVPPAADPPNYYRPLGR